MIRSLLALAPLALAAAASSQTTITVAPSDARTIFTTLSNSGFESGLTVGNNGPRAGSTSYRWQALFPLSGVPSGTTILSATIATTILSTIGSPPEFPLTLRYGAYGSESGTLTLDRPTGDRPGLSYASGAFDATAAARARLAAGTPYLGLLVDISSGTGTATWSAPTLTVTYAPVPEPSALAALGLSTFGLLRRRRKA